MIDGSTNNLPSTSSSSWYWSWDLNEKNIEDDDRSAEERLTVDKNVGVLVDQSKRKERHDDAHNWTEYDKRLTIGIAVGAVVMVVVVSINDDDNRSKWNDKNYDEHHQLWPE